MAENEQGEMPNLMLRAFMDEMTRRLNEALGPIEDRLHNIETINQRPNNGGPRERLREQEHGGELVQAQHRGAPRDNIKVKIPPFKGKSDPEAYIEWETRMEKIFTYQEYPEAKKVQIASLEFSDYALTWWDQLVTSRRRNGEEPINTWVEMKRIMRKRFVPGYYYRSLFNKLQTLRQGTLSVEEYYQEMETCMIRANIEEEAEATMARFLQGLNPEIHDVVEMQNYVDLQDLLHQATKVEAQIKRRNQMRRNSTYNNSYNSKPWSSSYQKQETPAFNLQSLTNPKVSTPKFETKSQQTSSSSTPQSKTRDLKCFRCQGYGHVMRECPNKRTMFINSNGEIESEEEKEETESEEETEKIEFEEGEEQKPMGGELLVARRVLNTQIKNKGANQRENLFYTRCLVKGKTCSVIVDGGSCTNVASQHLVSKLSLPTLKHPTPYSLQWFNDSNEVRVTRQVRVALAIGKYKDEILCDIVPMQACHILLGRPWQYDKNIRFDGRANRYTLSHNNSLITLSPLSPQEALNDQIKLQKKFEGTKVKEKHLKNKTDLVFQRECLLLSKNNVLRTNDPMLGKEIFLNTNNLAGHIPSIPLSLLQDSRTNPFEGGGDDSNNMEQGIAVDGANLESGNGDTTIQRRKLWSSLPWPLKSNASTSQVVEPKKRFHGDFPSETIN